MDDSAPDWRLATIDRRGRLVAVRSPRRRPPGHPVPDPHARRRRQRDGRGGRHQPRRPARHRVGRELVRGTGLDAAPVPRARISPATTSTTSATCRSTSNGDGYPDIVSVTWFAQEDRLVEESGQGGGHVGRRREIDTGFPVEFALLADLDNDGKAQEVLPQAGTTQTPLAWYEAKAGAGSSTSSAPQSYGHGIGAGDVNKDGRTDILTPRGWLEAPADPRAGPWTFHPDWESVNVTPPARGRAPQIRRAPPRVTDLGFMHVADVNGDGRNDVIAGGGARLRRVLVRAGRRAASGRGGTIDGAWSQAHASTLVDLNGDGQLDFVTGKRFMAHNGSDPGEREPLGVYWFEHRPGAPRARRALDRVDPPHHRLRRADGRRHADPGRRHRRRRRSRCDLRRQERTVPG